MMQTLAAQIATGDLAEGELLPREVDLAEEFRVSRGVTRESIRALEERGLLRVRHGRGATVAPRADWDLFDPDVIVILLDSPAAPEVLGDYLECRRIIEVEAAGLAAERISDADEARLGLQLTAMDHAVEVRGAVGEAAFHEADVAFHETIAEATGNRALATLARRVHTALLAARYPLARPAYRRDRALPEHRAIHDAIVAHKPLEARTAMTTHLDTVGRYLEEHARRVARG